MNTVDLNRDQIWQLITAQLSGNLAEPEQSKLQQWLKAHPEDELMFDQLQQIWERSMDLDIPASDTERQWQRLQAGVQKASQVPMILNQREGVLSKPRSYMWWGIAGLVLLASLGFLYNLTRSQGSTEQQAHQLGGVVPEIELKLPYKVDADSLWKTRLPDGTRVWLNKGAQLYYGDNFNIQDRQVKLIGEAYFEVHPDAARPFIIKAGPSSTKVLGTSFNLRSTPNEAAIQVVTGEVSFMPSSAPKEIVLKAGEAGSLRKNRLRKSKLSHTHFLDWKHALDYEYEISNPADFLSDNFRTKRSAINQTQIEGVIHNHAKLATYHDITLRIQYYSGKKEKMRSYQFTVYQTIGPGETIDYRYRLADWFSTTDAIEIKIIDASITKN